VDELGYNEKNVSTVMVNNSTYINKMNNHMSPPIIEQTNYRDIWRRKSPFWVYVRISCMVFDNKELKKRTISLFICSQNVDCQTFRDTEISR